MTVAEFRKYVKTNHPNVKITVRTVSFADLARVSRQCLTITGGNRHDVETINAKAKAAGIIPDMSVRMFKD